MPIHHATLALLTDGPSHGYEVKSLRATHASDPVVALLLSAAMRHVGADLAFLNDAERHLLGVGALEAIARARAAAAAPAEPERSAAHLG